MMPDITQKPAVRFVACMASTPIRLKTLFLHCLAQTPQPNLPLNAWIELKVENDENDHVYYVAMYASTAAGSLASEIIAAGTDGTLHIEVRKVTYKHFSQARILLFIGNRIVGQLFASRDGQHLRLAIAELSDARDLGDDVIAVEEQDFEIHAETLTYPAFTPTHDSGTVH